MNGRLHTSVCMQRPEDVNWGMCPVLLLSALFLISLRQGLSLKLEEGCYSASPSGSPVSICHRIKATDAHSQTQILMWALESKFRS